MNHRVLTTIATICLALPLWAQMGSFFDTSNQLSSSFVTQVYLDNDGFVWVTTRSGINRYDGYQFQVFRCENELGKTLASNYVIGMMQDSRGLFYFGMYGALQTWDGQEFHNVTMLDANGKPNRCYASCFLERRNGDVLVGSSGLGVMKIVDSQTAQQMGGPLSSLHTINEMIEDRWGNLWIVTDREGLIRYDGKDVRYYMEDKKDLLMRELCEDQEGNIYVGTAKGGLFRQQGDGFVHVDGLGNTPVSELYRDRHGNILIGFDGQGAGIYHPKTGEVTLNPFFSQEVDLSKSKVYSITEDRSGNIWLGMLQKGIYKQPGAATGFNYMGYRLGDRNRIGSACVISLAFDRGGRTWVGTDKDGLYCFDKDDNLIRHYYHEIPTTVMTIAEDHDGRIWLGAYGGGCGWIDPKSGHYHPFNYPVDKNLSIMDIAVDKSGMLWMATMSRGVLCVDPTTGQFRDYNMKEGAETDSSLNSITNNYISQISISPDGKRVYASTSMGVCCLDIESDSWTKTFGINCLNYGTPVRIAREYGGKLLIGTTGGVYIYDFLDKQLTHFTTDDGLPDNGIASIEQDLDGKLWISTDHGLSKMDPKTKRFHNYFVDDGLQSNEFSDGASWVTGSGTLLFAGTGGVTWFKPKDLPQPKWEAKVLLTAFLVNGESVTPATISDGYQVTDTTVIASDRFNLSYHDNSFAIQFSTLTYENPEHISYLYSINGEPYVRLRSGVNELTFSHLPPGTYRFRVKAERNNSETVAREFVVIVHAPWYRSAWAYTFYLLLLGAAVWYYLTTRRRKEQDRLRLQEHIHAEEMGEAKLRFFMNISHEIRTPMTLITTPLLSLIKNEDDPHKKSIYETIRRNAERILSLINQMMDLRKIDKGMMQMRMQETELVAFVKDVHALFETQAKAKNITLTYEHDTDQLPVWIDRKNFDKVIVNILSNAFKFTSAGGKIGIAITHDDGHATIAIRDNGEKIPEDKLEKIFERFYQTASSVNDRNTGTGIGLDLTRSLVELHHGTIRARNLDEGCEFAVTLPLGNEHLKPEEMMMEKEVEEKPETEETVAEEPQPVLLAQPANKRLTLVIAEDDDEIRDYLDMELSKDYDVHVCTNGREALSETIRVVPDLVLSDIMMPEMDGNTLCSKLKTNPNTNHIPVVLLTAKSRDEDKLEGLETGADAYIVKPFNMDILRRTIINLINTHRLLQLKYGRNDGLEEKLDEIVVRSPDEKLLERVMNAINAHLDDSDLSVDMIADEVGISRVHLHRKMKELTGQTPHDFIRNLRLKQAANLLANQGMNVTEVMYACGFANSASFSTVFKKFYGVSPRDYMKEHSKR